METIDIIKKKKIPAGVQSPVAETEPVSISGSQAVLEAFVAEAEVF